MNYIYNILVCLNKLDLDIFEWNNNDVVEIRKTPLYRYDDINELTNKNGIINNDILNKIKGKTKSNSKIEYGCVLASFDLALFLVFDINGNIKYKSKMLYNEEQESICISTTLNNLDNIFSNISNDDYNYYNLYEDNEKKKYVNNELNKIISSSKIEKLNYLYFELYGYIIDDIDQIKHNIIKKYMEAYKILFDISLICK